MASIQTGIELNDQFSSVLNNIMGSVNLAISAMYDMQQSMNADIDTSSLEGARDEINQATASINEMNEAMQKHTVPDIAPPVTENYQAPVSAPVEPVIPTEPVKIPVQWETDGLDVFTGSGVERFQQEVQSANTMLEQLSSTQDAIAKQAYNTMIFPPEAFQNLNSMAVRIDMIRDRVQQIENNPVNMGTNTANAELEQLRGQLNQALLAQNNLNTAMQNMDVSAANDAYLQLSQTVSNTERYIRDNTDEQGQFNQKIQEGTSLSNGLMNTIKGAAAAYISIQGIGKALSISDELTQTTARLNMMNDGLQGTDELVNMVYAAAQDARGSFSQMADVVARFGNNAKDAFGSSEEVVAFADLVQKQMTIAGASTQEAANAELQLSQALGSGVLRGDELNSIFEQSPNLIQNIADYLDVPIGKIREMAADGELSADTVKAAIFAAADDINTKFDEMPMTWGQIWQSMQNTALIAFQPVLQRLNDVANSEAFQSFVNGAIEAMATLSNIVLNVFDLIGQVGGFIADNWSIIAPIVLGVAAAFGVYTLATKGAALAVSAWTAIQSAFNAVMNMNPVALVVIGIILLIAVIFAVCNAIAKMAGIAQSGFGVMTGAIFVVGATIKNLGLIVANIALGIWNALGALTDNMKTAFHNAISSVQAWFYDLLSTALDVIAGIAAALNKLPFVEFDYSGISSAADDYAAKSAAAASNKEDYQSVGDAFDKGFSTYDTFQDGWASSAFDSGAAWGDGIADKVSNFSLSDIFGKTNIPNPDDYTSGFADAIADSGMGGNLDNISGNTAAIADTVNATKENLKYMRDMAEQEVINRFTTAEVKIEQTNHNNISSDMDLDGLISGLDDAMGEAIDIITEGSV